MTYTTFWLLQLAITALIVWIGGVSSGRTRIAVATALGLGPFVAVYRLFVELLRDLQ